MKLSELKIDSKRLNAGEWVNVPGLPGFRVKTRSITNYDFRRAQERRQQKASRGLARNETLPPETRERINRACFLEYCLLDWSGLTDDDGTPIAFTQETAQRYFDDPDYAPLVDACFGAAALVGELDAEDIEAAAKNSAPPSAGT
jgi:hypothetical protein